VESRLKPDSHDPGKEMRYTTPNNEIILIRFRVSAGKIGLHDNDKR
jgi:hypothetical protein